MASPEFISDTVRRTKCERPSSYGHSTWRSSDQIARLGLQPVADDAGALLAISRPLLREAVVGHVVILDAERVPDNLGGPVAVIAVDRLLALVASSIDVVRDGDNLKNVPDNKVYVIDLTASPPAVIATVQTGKQPSGLAINRAGNLALVANRADNSVSVLSISGKTVSVASTVALAPADAPAQQPSAVAITPDRKRALVAKACCRASRRDDQAV